MFFVAYFTYFLTEIITILLIYYYLLYYVQNVIQFYCYFSFSSAYFTYFVTKKRILTPFYSFTDNIYNTSENTMRQASTGQRREKETNSEGAIRSPQQQQRITVYNSQSARFILGANFRRGNQSEPTAV